MTDMDILHEPNMNRRRLLLAGFAIAAVGVLGKQRAANAANAENLVSIETFSASGKSTGIAQVPKVVKTDSEWRAELSPLAYDVTRRAGTEAPFSGEYASNHADGIYGCICCGTALYDSRTKFESGTGWPSFYRAISSRNVVKSSDTSLFMSRDAISCRRCDAHLGHVFDDGPQPTGLRYCMNSVSLKFAPRAAV